MERLTNSKLAELHRNGAWGTHEYGQEIHSQMRWKKPVTFEDAYTRLAELEDKLENGELIEKDSSHSKQLLVNAIQSAVFDYRFQYHESVLDEVQIDYIADWLLKCGYFKGVVND